MLCDRTTSRPSLRRRGDKAALESVIKFQEQKQEAPEIGCARRGLWDMAKSWALWDGLDLNKNVAALMALCKRKQWIPIARALETLSL